MGSKIVPGGPLAAKGRSSKTCDFLSKTIVFEVGRCLGAVQIEFRIVFGILLVFSSILDSKSGQKLTENGSREAPKSIPKFNFLWD